MNNLNYFKNAVKPTKKFIEEISRNFYIIEYTSKGKTLKTTDRVSNIKRVKTIRLTKNVNLSRENRTIFGIRLVGRVDKIELQTYGFYRTFENKEHPKEVIEYNLVNLVVLENGEIFSKKNAQLSNMGYSYPVYLEDKSMKEILNNTELKYLSNHVENFTSYDLATFEKKLIMTYKYKEIIEVLNNMKAFALIDSITSGYEDMRVITPNYLKRNKRWIKQGLMPRHIEQLDYISKFYPLNDTNLQKIRFNELVDHEIQNILNFEKDNDIRERKLLRYLDKQECNLHYYEDYLSIMADLGLDTTHWTKQFPKNLTEAHDYAVAKRNEQRRIEKEMETKERNANYQKVINEIKELEIFENDYALIVPKDLMEIIDEGKALSHCVSGSHYVNKQAKEHLIMFVRKADDLDQPYFTVQLNKKGEIVQVHGYQNEGRSEKGQIARKELPEVKQFVESVVLQPKYQKLYSNVVETAFY